MRTTLWKAMLSSEQRLPFRFRLAFLMLVALRAFGDWWPLYLSCIILAIGLPLVLTFQLIVLESARWALSALVQAGAALIGIFFVALGLLWSQATQEQEKLRQLMPTYINRIISARTKSKPLLDSLEDVFIESTKDNASRLSAQEMRSLADCFWRLVVLKNALFRYQKIKVTPEELLAQAEHFGMEITDETRVKLHMEAVPVYLNERDFFKHLLDFDNKLSMVKKYLKPVNRSLIIWERIMHHARREDYVGISLRKIQFWGYFSGRSLKITILLWSLCLTAGLLILLTLNRIPDSMLPYLVSVPIAIGVIAIGTTLSLGLRAMRSRG